jgi:hypothetical protein
MGRIRRFFGADPSLIWLGVGTSVGLIALVLYGFQFGWTNRALTTLTSVTLVAGAALNVSK